MSRCGAGDIMSRCGDMMSRCGAGDIISLELEVMMPLEASRCDITSSRAIQAGDMMPL